MTKKVANVYNCYHPDFIDHGDGTYEILPTGKWVVEWDEIIKVNLNLANNVKHYTKDFQNESDAIAFMRELWVFVRQGQQSRYRQLSGYSKQSEREIQELDKLDFPF